MALAGQSSFDDYAIGGRPILKTQNAQDRLTDDIGDLALTQPFLTSKGCGVERAHAG
jgi:hypothetical protein